jgi:hypothetical protein
VRSGGRMVFAAAITGVLAGLGGLVLTLLLHAVQHAAFGYTEDTFLIGSSRRRAGGGSWRWRSAASWWGSAGGRCGGTASDFPPSAMQ